MKMYDIWKIQRPLFGGMQNESTGLVLAYTQDKSQTAHIPMALEDIDNLFGDEAKLYIAGEVKNGNLIVHGILDEVEMDW